MEQNNNSNILKIKGAAVLWELFEIARQLSSTTDLDSLLSKIGKAAEQLTAAEASSILLVDEDGKHLYFKVATGEKEWSVKKLKIPIGQGIAGWVAEKCEAAVINDVQKDPRFTGQVDKASGFVTHSILAVPMTLSGELIGVCEVLNKSGGRDFTDDDLGVLTNLSGLAAVTINNVRLLEDQRNFFTHVIEILITAIESRQPKSAGHSMRVAEMSCAIGRLLGIVDQDYRNLYYGALLHDIGYLAVNNEQILLRVTRTGTVHTTEELHPIAGAELIKGINLLKGVIPLVRHHHEYYNGTGSPDHLRGEAIPLGARIICLVEHTEELRLSGLKGPELEKAANQMIKDGYATRFDPKVVDAYMTLTAEKAFT